ncbi:MAG: DUF1501 domain-containing protein [Pirellulaceae bacterium]
MRSHAQDQRPSRPGPLAASELCDVGGGKLRHGQVIGETDRIAGEAISRPVTFGDIYATLFHHLGIDIDQTTITDTTGRPRYLVSDEGRIMPELV